VSYGAAVIDPPVPPLDVLVVNVPVGMVSSRMLNGPATIPKVQIFLIQSHLLVPLGKTHLLYLMSP
jgi:hypothetical protein